MDFTPRGNVFARFTHLQHLDFVYRINVTRSSYCSNNNHNNNLLFFFNFHDFLFQIENNTGQNRAGTVRIFLAPKLDERGLPWLFADQRHMFIELDKFPVACKTPIRYLKKLLLLLLFDEDN